MSNFLPFRCVAIIGLGLIGGSLAKTIRRYRLAKSVVAYDQDTAALDMALQSKIIDQRAASAAMATVQADFIQQVFDPVSGGQQQWQGQLWLQKPDKLRITIREPDPQQIVADGTQVWQYDALLAQVIVQPQSQVIDGTSPLTILLENKQLQRIQPISLPETQPDNLRTYYRLPGSDGMQHDITVTLYSGILESIAFRDGLNNPVLLLFSQVLLNAPIDPEKFQFIPPDNVDVVVQ